LKNILEEKIPTEDVTEKAEVVASHETFDHDALECVADQPRSEEKSETKQVRKRDFSSCPPITVIFISKESFSACLNTSSIFEIRN